MIDIVSIFLLIYMLFLNTFFKLGAVMIGGLIEAKV